MDFPASSGVQRFGDRDGPFFLGLGWALLLSLPVWLGLGLLLLLLR